MSYTDLFGETDPQKARCIMLFRRKFAAAYPDHPWVAMWAEEEAERRAKEKRLIKAIFGAGGDNAEE